MATGIRAEVSIDAPSTCPIASASGQAGTSCYSVSKSTSPTGDVTEEFMLDADIAIEDIDLDEDVESVFAYGDKQVYRFERESNQPPCPCESVELLNCPVADVYTESGTLHLSFHATDMDQLQAVLGSLRENHDNVSVKRLLRSTAEADEHNLIFVDRSELTPRQREVLETAHDMGYFQHPKGANAGEVAEALDISTSTFTEHLSAAQRKLLRAILEG